LDNGIHLDAGHGKFSSAEKCPRAALVTHGHSDHCQGSLSIISRQTREMKKTGTGFPQKHTPIFSFPSNHKQRLLDLWYASKRMDVADGTTACDPDIVIPDFRFVRGGEVFDIEEQGTHQNVRVEVIPLDHSVQTVGYILSVCKVTDHDMHVFNIGRNQRKKEAQRARNELGLTGKNIREHLDRMVADGTLSPATGPPKTVFPILGYITDTSIEPFCNDAWLSKVMSCECVMVECSFLPKHGELGKKHICWTDLKPVIVAHPDVTFVLIHWSCRYTERQIEDFFATEEHFSNIVLWLDSKVVEFSSLRNAKCCQ
jgi:hypothetical protein